MGKIFSGNHLKLRTTHGAAIYRYRHRRDAIYRVSIYRVPAPKTHGLYLDAINRVSTEINLWLIGIR